MKGMVKSRGNSCLIYNYEANFMNIRTYVILLSLVVVSGCWKRKKNAVCTNGTVTEQKSGYTANGQKNVFDEDVEAFTLEDDQNPFGNPEGNQRVGGDNSLWTPGNRKGGFEAIYYDFDEEAIRPDQQAALDRTIQKLKNTDLVGFMVVVEGHACTSGGTPVYNMSLSVGRAKSAAQKVAEVLVAKGIPANKLKVVGRGSEMCKVAGGDKEQQAPNRRVEIYLVQG